MSGRIWTRSGVAAAIAAASLLAAATPAGAASTGLHFQRCVTGELQSGPRPGPAASNACSKTRFAGLDGSGSGLTDLGSIAATADGRSVYTTSPSDDALATWAAKPRLKFQSCVSGDKHVRHKHSRTCGFLPTADDGDAPSGLDSVRFVAASPDGHTIYSVSPEDGAIATFARAPSGKLAYKGCLDGLSGHPIDEHVDNPCTPIPTATSSFYKSGLDRPVSVAVSPDGHSLYAAAPGDTAIAIFSRASDGTLTWQGCLTGDLGVSTGGGGPCTAIAGASDGGIESGMESVYGLAISPDGTSLYASAPDDAAVAMFARDPGSGALTYKGCIGGEITNNRGINDPCSLIPSAQVAAFDSGMWLIKQLAISADGRSLYGVTRGDDSVVSFSRDPATGALTYDGCITGESSIGPAPGSGACSVLPSATEDGVGSGLGAPSAIALAPNGNLIVASRREDSLTAFTRNSGSGALTWSGCISSNTNMGHRREGPCSLIRSAHGGGVNSGMDTPVGLARAGNKLYVASKDDDGVAQFRFGG